MDFGKEFLKVHPKMLSNGCKQTVGLQTVQFQDGFYVMVAQLVERLSEEQVVGGSNPSRHTS